MGFFSTEQLTTEDHLASRVGSFLEASAQRGGFKIVGDYEGIRHAIILNGDKQLLIVNLAKAAGLDMTQGMTGISGRSFNAAPLDGSRNYNVDDNLYEASGDRMIGFQSIARVRLQADLRELTADQIVTAVTYCVRELGEGTALQDIGDHLRNIRSWA